MGGQIVESFVWISNAAYTLPYSMTYSTTTATTTTITVQSPDADNLPNTYITSFITPSAPLTN